MDTLNFLTNLKISFDVGNLYRSLDEGDIPWYYPTAFIVLLIGIVMCLVAIIIESINLYKEKAKESEKIKLFDIPQKKLVQSNGQKNKAKKLMEKIYLPKSKEQILEIMKTVGANRVFIKGGKGAISGEFCTKDDIIDEIITSNDEQSNSIENVDKVSKREPHEIAKDDIIDDTIMSQHDSKDEQTNNIENVDKRYLHRKEHHEIEMNKNVTVADVLESKENFDENTKQFVNEKVKSEKLKEIHSKKEDSPAKSSSKLVKLIQKLTPPPSVCINCDLDLKFPHSTSYHDTNKQMLSSH